MGEEVKWARFSPRILQFHPETYMRQYLYKPNLYKIVSTRNDKPDV